MPNESFSSHTVSVEFLVSIISSKSLQVNLCVVFFSFSELFWWRLIWLIMACQKKASLGLKGKPFLSKSVLFTGYLRYLLRPAAINPARPLLKRSNVEGMGTGEGFWVRVKLSKATWRPLAAVLAAHVPKCRDCGTADPLFCSAMRTHEPLVVGSI